MVPPPPPGCERKPTSVGRLIMVRGHKPRASGGSGPVFGGPMPAGAWRGTSWILNGLAPSRPAEDRTGGFGALDDAPPSTYRDAPPV
jgi:hypothetical protein